MLRTVQFVNELLGNQTNRLFVNRLIYSSYRINCHVHALFVNDMYYLHVQSVMVMNVTSYYHVSFAKIESCEFYR